MDGISPLCSTGHRPLLGPLPCLHLALAPYLMAGQGYRWPLDAFGRLVQSLNVSGRIQPFPRIFGKQVTDGWTVPLIENKYFLIFVWWGTDEFWWVWHTLGIAHSFACSVRLVLLARSAALIRSLARLLTHTGLSGPHGKEIYNVLELNASFSYHFCPKSGSRTMQRGGRARLTIRSCLSSWKIYCFPKSSQVCTSVLCSNTLENILSMFSMQGKSRAQSWCQLSPEVTGEIFWQTAYYAIFYMPAFFWSYFVLALACEVSIEMAWVSESIDNNNEEFFKISRTESRAYLYFNL